jgi:hypothetical protein
LPGKRVRFFPAKGGVAYGCAITAVADSQLIEGRQFVKTTILSQNPQN